MNVTTTYRDDYESPFEKNFPIPPITLNVEPKTCQNPEDLIHNNKKLHENVARHECTMPPESASYEWSRLGPMGCLLEPKLYPVKPDLSICAGKSMKCNDCKNGMKVFGESLIVRKPSMPGYDTLRILHENRLKSSYQVDYDHLGKYCCVRDCIDL